MQNFESNPESALAILSAHERELSELRTKLRDMLGLVICELRDPGGRVVTYDYHWQRPDACGIRVGGLVVGYPTLLAAIVAGLLADGASGLIDEAAAHNVLRMGERWGRCENEGREIKDEF